MGVLLGWSQHSLEVMALGLRDSTSKGAKHPAGRASHGHRPHRLCARAGEGGGEAGAHVAGVLRRSVPCPPAGRLGRSMCSCGRHLAGSRSAGDVNQAGRKGP